jgi:hypothetical protein
VSASFLREFRGLPYTKKSKYLVFLIPSQNEFIKFFLGSYREIQNKNFVSFDGQIWLDHILGLIERNVLCVSNGLRGFGGGLLRFCEKAIYQDIVFWVEGGICVNTFLIMLGSLEMAEISGYSASTERGISWFKPIRVTNSKLFESSSSVNNVSS